MEYAVHKQNIITEKANLEPLYSYKSFPVSFGYVDMEPKEDVRADMSWSIRPNSHFTQILRLLPLEILYQTQHSDGMGSTLHAFYDYFSGYISKQKSRTVSEICGSQGNLTEPTPKNQGGILDNHKTEPTASISEKRDVIPDTVKLVNTTCPLCGGSDSVSVLSSSDRLTKLPGRYQVVRCLGCGLMRTNPRPSEKSIAYYYPDDYSPFQKQRPFPKKIHGARKAIGWLAHQIFRFNNSTVPKTNGKKMLEIGCGSGRYLAAMKEQGWDVEGVEPSPFAARAAQKVSKKIYVCSIEDLNLENVTFDLVVGWTVFEHLHQPLRVLQKIRAVMKKDSYLVLSMPNASSFSYRLFGKYTIDWDVPRHLFHFTPRTLAKIAAKAGLNVVKISHHRVLSNMISSLGFFLEAKIPAAHSSLFRRFTQWCINYATNAGYAHLVLYPLAFVLASFGQTGRMTVWLQRDDATIQ